MCELYHHIVYSSAADGRVVCTVKELRWTLARELRVNLPVPVPGLFAVARALTTLTGLWSLVLCGQHVPDPDRLFFLLL